MLAEQLFFPPGSAAASSSSTSSSSSSQSSRRCLLVGPPQSGKTSMLFQLALNRARMGLPSLYIACGSRDSLETWPPVRPRLSAAAASSTTATTPGSRTAAAAEDANEEQQTYGALALVHVKYASSWSELRDVLSSLHLEAAKPAAATGLPRALLIDGLSSFFAKLGSGSGGGGGGASTSASGGAPPHHLPTPSPHKLDQQGSTMFLALGLALAAHAADYLDSPAAAARMVPPPSADASSAAALSAPSAPEPTLLVVSCSSLVPAVVDMAGRWLPTLLRVSPAGTGVFSLVQKQNGALGEEEGAVRYRFVSGRTLELLPPSQQQLHQQFQDVNNMKHLQPGAANPTTPYAGRAANRAAGVTPAPTSRPSDGRSGSSSLPFASAVF